MLELAIALTLYGDNFLRNVARASKETENFKAVVSALRGENAFNLLAKEADETSREVKETTKEAKRAEKEFRTLGATIKQAFDPKNLNSFSEKLEDITLKAGAIGGTITLSIKSAVADATEFEKGLAEASTLVKTDFEKFKKLYSNQLLAISVSLGQEKNQVTKAFYDAISSGFSPQKALEIIKQAGKAAVAGVSDISTANNTLITVMKAWHLPLKQASDYIFKTIAKGRTTFTEIARNIGGAAAIISSAGIKFNEFSAIVAAATAKGLDTAQTMTSIREIVNSLIAPTTQAEKAFAKLGITVNKETLKKKGLVGTLKEITDAMKRAGLSEAEQAKMLSEIFGSVEAQKVVNMFVADPETFVNTLKEFQKTGGETEEAFKKMSQSTWFAFNRLSEAFSSTKIVIGNLFLPVITFGANALTSFALSVKNFTQEHKTLAKVLAFSIGAFGGLAVSVASVAAATAFLLKSTALTIEGLKALATAGKFLFNVFKFGATVIRALTVAMASNPLILVGLAIAGIGFLIYRNWDKVKPAILGVWKAVKGFFSSIGALISKAGIIGKSVLTAFKGFATGLGSLFSKATGLVKFALVKVAKALILNSPFALLLREWKKVVQFFANLNLFKSGVKIISTIVEGVKAKASELYNTVKGVLGKVRNLLPFSPAKEGPLSDLHKTGLRFIETIAASMEGAPLFTKLSGLLQGVKSLFLSSPPAMALSAIVTPGVRELPRLRATTAGGGAPSYSVNINVSVNGKADRETAVEIARAVEPVVRKVLKEIQRKEARVSYGFGDAYLPAR